MVSIVRNRTANQRGDRCDPITIAMRHRSRAWIFFTILLTTSESKARAEEVDLGGLVIFVSDSWTAQLFHIVDQLSEWDDASHRQYGRWAAKALNFDQQDRRLLQEHAELRRARGWENGFERAFYVEDSIEVAAEKAVETNL